MNDIELHKMIARLIDREGGEVDHELDRGGRTNFGITQYTLDIANAHSLIERKLPKSVSDLSREDAAYIYEILFYNAPKLYLMPDLIQEFMLDMCVHHGQGDAAKILQRACEVADDGIIGDITRNAASALSEIYGTLFIDRLVAQRKSFILDIIADDPDQAVFAKGWVNRINKVLGGE